MTKSKPTMPAVPAVDDPNVFEALRRFHAICASQRAHERFVAAYRALRMARHPRPLLAAKAAGWVERERVDARALSHRYLTTHRDSMRADMLMWWRIQRAAEPYARRLP